jgi:hypothetical protein
VLLLSRFFDACLSGVLDFRLLGCGIGFFAVESDASEEDLTDCDMGATDDMVVLGETILGSETKLGGRSGRGGGGLTRVERSLEDLECFKERFRWKSISSCSFNVTDL